MLNRIGVLAVFFGLLLLGSVTVAQDTNFDPKSKETVLAAQEALVELGFEPGTPDGLMGRNTRNAIRAFQKSAGAEETGEITEELFVQFEAARGERRATAALEARDLPALKEALAAMGEQAPSGKSFARALKKAVGDGDIELATILLDAGVQGTSNGGADSLLFTALRASKPDMLALLAASLKNLDPVDRRKMTPLVKAIYESKADHALALIDAGADIKNTAYSGLTPLHFAAAVGLVDIGRRLLDMGADPATIGGRSRRIALELAIINGHADMTELLMAAGPLPPADSDAFQSNISMQGVFGENGLIVGASGIGARGASLDGGQIKLTTLELNAEGDKTFPVTYPEDANGNTGNIRVIPGSEGRTDGAGMPDISVALGPEGSTLPVKGGTHVLKKDGTGQKIAFTQLIVGPDGTLAGSHVIGTSKTATASSAAGIAAAGLGAAKLPNGAVVFALDAKMNLQKVD